MITPIAEYCVQLRALMCYRFIKNIAQNCCHSITQNCLVSGLICSI